MQQLLFLSAILALSSAALVGTTVCTCKNFALLANCPATCIWNTTGNTCTAPTVNTATTQAQCWAANGVWKVIAPAWQATCTAFTSCTAIVLTDTLACAAAYPTCTWVTPATTCSLATVNPPVVCSSFSTAATCNGQITTVGYCYFNSSNACVVATACSQFPVAYCPNGPQCQTVSAVGTTPASCAAATCASLGATAATCTYIVNSLSFTSESITACALTRETPVVCANAPDVSVLNTPTLCSTNTGGTYTWSSNDAASGTCKSCNSGLGPYVIGDTSCDCPNYRLQSTCEESGDCIWSTLRQICQLPTIKTSTNKLQCYKANGFLDHNDQCQPFSNCAQIQRTSIQRCEYANPNCTWVGGVACIEKPAIPACAANTKANCSGKGADGYCFWNGVQCNAATQCSDFSQSVCESISDCYWDAVVCASQTCRNKSKDSCTSTNLSLDPKKPLVAICAYNIHTESCEYAISNSHLNTPNNCDTGTSHTFTWSSNQVEGYCQKCNAPLLPQVMGDTTCTCENFALQSLCLNPCIWVSNTNTCQSPIIFSAWNSEQCYSVKGVWTPATATEGYSCAPFTSCSSIKLDSVEDCTLAYAKCTWKAGNTCIESEVPCRNLKTADDCNVKKGHDGYCVWEHNKCLPAQACSDFKSQVACELPSNTCLWDQDCIPSTCNSLANKCTYVNNSLDPMVTDVTLCDYNPWYSSEMCIYAQSVSDLTDSCQTNTFNSYTWSSNSINEGQCIKCEIRNPPLQPLVQGSNSCLCSNFLLEVECSVTGGLVCVWNISSQKCEKPTLKNATNQEECNAAQGVWTLLENNQAGKCKQFTSCNAIKGSSLAECQYAYPTCSWTEGVTCIAVNTPIQPACMTFESAAECHGQMVDKIPCIWNQKSCILPKSCSQLNSNALCNIFPNTCQWISTLCVQRTCASFKVDDCKYVSTSFIESPNSIWACVITGTPEKCDFAQKATDLSTYQICSQNTRNTYTWSSQELKNGFCRKCAKPGDNHGFIINGLKLILTAIFLA